MTTVVLWSSKGYMTMFAYKIQIFEHQANKLDFYLTIMVYTDFWSSISCVPYWCIVHYSFGWYRSSEVGIHVLKELTSSGNEMDVFTVYYFCSFDRWKRWLLSIWFLILNSCLLNRRGCQAGWSKETVAFTSFKDMQCMWFLTWFVPCLQI